MKKDDKDFKKWVKPYDWIYTIVNIYVKWNFYSNIKNITNIKIVLTIFQRNFKPWRSKYFNNIFWNLDSFTIFLARIVITISHNVRLLLTTIKVLLLKWNLINKSLFINFIAISLTKILAIVKNIQKNIIFWVIKEIQNINSALLFNIFKSL